MRNFVGRNFIKFHTEELTFGGNLGLFLNFYFKIQTYSSLFGANLSIIVYTMDHHVSLRLDLALIA